MITMFCRCISSTIRHVPVLICALLVFTGSGRAQPVQWAAVGGWDISFYPNAKGCQALALYDQETAFIFGFDAAGGDLALAVTLLDPHWTFIEPDQEYPITAQFGDESTWTLAMQGVVRGDFPGLTFTTNASSDQADLLIQEFQKERNMSWRNGNDLLGHFTLNASYRAFEAVRACQRAQKDGLTISGQVKN
jgi:hypothetical protein